MQYYSCVIHLVSRVSGTLAKRPTPSRPSSTPSCRYLSGAPKYAPCNSISQLELHNRGAYGGCIGSSDQRSNDSYFVSRNGVLVQAGVAYRGQSNDEYELQEVNNKPGALKKAIEMEKCSLCDDGYDGRFAVRHCSQQPHRKIK